MTEWVEVKKPNERDTGSVWAYIDQDDETVSFTPGILNLGGEGYVPNEHEAVTVPFHTLVDIVNCRLPPQPPKEQGT